MGGRETSMRRRSQERRSRRSLFRIVHVIARRSMSFIQNRARMRRDTRKNLLPAVTGEASTGGGECITGGDRRGKPNLLSRGVGADHS